MPKINILFLNGQKYHLHAEHETTLSELVIYFNCNTSLLILEYNNLICNKKNWKTISIKNNDKIELITIVGGG